MQVVVEKQKKQNMAEQQEAQLQGGQESGAASTREGAPRKVVFVETAESNRSKCKNCACLGLIQKGDARVGVPMFAAGRTITGWFHPACFVKDGLVAEIVERNAGLCKQTRRKFAKGDFRLRVSCGNAKFGLSQEGAKKLYPKYSIKRAFLPQVFLVSTAYLMQSVLHF